MNFGFDILWIVLSERYGINNEMVLNCVLLRWYEPEMISKCCERGVEAVDHGTVNKAARSICFVFAEEDMV